MTEVSDRLARAMAAYAKNLPPTSADAAFIYAARHGLARAAVAELSKPTEAMVTAGALAIMNERLRQKGVPPLPNLDMLYPDVLLEVVADAKAAWQGMIEAAAE
jgi:hypothetical protein